MFKLSTEPAAWSELIRQGILLMVLFQVVHWTDTQIAAVVMFVSLVLTVITRQSVMPVATIVKSGNSVMGIKAAAATNIAAEEKQAEAVDAAKAVEAAKVQENKERK